MGNPNQNRVFFKGIQKLTASDKRRIALTEIAKEFGKGGKTIVAKELHVSSDTIRKSLLELETDVGG